MGHLNTPSHPDFPPSAQIARLIRNLKPLGA